MKKASDELIFRDLDGDVQISDPTWPLERWYARVRDIPIAKMNLADLARCCRQRLYPEVAIPAALERLRADPGAGEMYDGELLRAVEGASSEYWASHPDERAMLLAVAERVCE